MSQQSKQRQEFGRNDGFAGNLRKAACTAAVAVGVLLAATACSGDSAATGTKATPSASVKVVGGTPKVSLPPAAPRVARPTLTALDGVAYAPAGAAAKTVAAATARQNRQVINATTVRSVQVGGRAFGDIMVFSVARSYLGSAVFKRQFASSVVASLADPGAQPAFKEVSGRTVLTAAGKTNVVAGYSGSRVVAVRSTAELDSVIDLVSRYLKATKSSSVVSSDPGSGVPAVKVTDPVG